MSETCICPECLVARPRILFSDGVCHICAGVEINPFSHRAVTTKTAPVKTPEQAKKQQEQALRLQAEKERAEKERQEAFDKEQEARRELAKREAARRNLLPFVMYFNEDYTPGWVHADICQRLERFSKDVAEGKSPRLMLFMPPRHGKQLADSTPVLTIDGWKTHGELKVGDYVFHHSGKPVRVMATSEKTPSDYVVTFSNGERIRCHGNHEWAVRHDRKKISVFTTLQLKDNLHRTEGRGKTRYINQMPDIQPIHRSRVDLELHPYVLGLWLGDGSSSKAAITHDVKDQPMIDKVVSCGHAISSVCVHNTTGVITTYFDGDRKANGGYKDGRCGKMMGLLRGLNLINNKHIPEKYFLGSIEQRMELLAGLIDSDGCCDKNGRIVVSTTNTAIRDGVLRLTTELGFRSHYHTEEPVISSSGVQGRLPVYCVGFNPTTQLPQVIVRKISTRPGVRRAITIRNIEYAPNGEVGNCIQVDSADGLYLAGKKLIPTHNSEIASKTFPAWHLGHHPNHDIIGCSYSAALAIDFSRKVRGLVQDERYPNIFKDTLMDETSQSAERWNTSTGGGYVAAGVQGPITGRGAHIAVIDDPVKDREAAESETTRQAIKDWYSSTLYTRLAPGGGILVIQTRWHEDDLGGWLLEQMKEAEQEMAETGEWPSDADRWEVVRYPAIATHDEEYRKSCEALHPERYPLKSLNRIKRTLIPRDWEALYQQNPVSADGDYFKKDNFILYDTAPPLEALRIYAAWDLAIGQKTTNDFTCGVVVGIDRSNDIWVLHRYYGRWGSDQLIQQFFECQRVWNPTLQGIEHGQIEMTLEPFILKEMAEKKQKFNYIKLKTRGNDKMTRARPIQGRMEQSRVHFPRNAPWFQEMQNEMLAFPSGKHDDQVDALAWIGQMILMLTPQREKKPPAKKGWRYKLRAENRLTNTSGTSHMAS